MMKGGKKKEKMKEITTQKCSYASSYTIEGVTVRS